MGIDLKNRILSFVSQNSYLKLAAWSAGLVVSVFVVFAVLTTTVKWLKLPNADTVRANQLVCEALRKECLDRYPERHQVYDLVACDVGEAQRRGLECYDLSDITWGSIFDDKFRIGGLFEGSLILGFMAAVTACIAKFLVTQPHAGWRRLSVVSGVVGSAASYYILEDDYRNDELFIYWYWYTAAFFLAPIGLNSVYSWVRTGFGAPIEGTIQKTFTHQTPPIQPKKEADPLEIDESVEKAREVREVTWAPAKFWNRFFARSLDLIIVFAITNVITLFVPDIPPSGSWFVLIVLINLVITAAILCAVYYWYEVYCLSKFGATLGKMALGLRVENKNHEPLLSKEEAKARTTRLLRDGLCFMFFFPWLQIFATISAWRRRDGTQPWDGACGSTVLQKHINPIRSLLFKILGLFLVIALVLTVQTVKEMEKRQLRDSVHQNYLR